MGNIINKEGLEHIAEVLDEKYISDAPSNEDVYGRKNGRWAATIEVEPKKRHVESINFIERIDSSIFAISKIPPVGSLAIEFLGETYYCTKFHADINGMIEGDAWGYNDAMSIFMGSEPTDLPFTIIDAGMYGAIIIVNPANYLELTDGEYNKDEYYALIERLRHSTDSLKYISETGGKIPATAVDGIVPYIGDGWVDAEVADMNGTSILSNISSLPDKVVVDGVTYNLERFYIDVSPGFNGVGNYELAYALMSGEDYEPQEGDVPVAIVETMGMFALFTIGDVDLKVVGKTYVNKIPAEAIEGNIGGPKTWEVEIDYDQFYELYDGQSVSINIGGIEGLQDIYKNIQFGDNFVLSFSGGKMGSAICLLQTSNDYLWGNTSYFVAGDEEVCFLSFYVRQDSMEVVYKHKKFQEKS